jgi:transposase
MGARFMQENRKQRRQRQQEEFLAAYAETRSLNEAFSISGVSRSTHYLWMSKYTEYRQHVDELGDRRFGISKGYKYAPGTRPKRWCRDDQEAFLTALAKTGFVTEAAKEVGFYHHHFGWLKTEEWYRERAEMIFAETADKRVTAPTSIEIAVADELVKRGITFEGPPG